MIARGLGPLPTPGGDLSSSPRGCLTAWPLASLTARGMRERMHQTAPPDGRHSFHKLTSEVTAHGFLCIVFT